ncbi:hypothetical protein NE237_009742 [Protea cynaroides]|uniref:Uncharacterized protein n=1 Tax=Protea cynaroides TaxID=273540 RepID=A0A9Q0KYC5_9MAGN|nr:hypothetical protein NE237_009742 [Protea cynaroides]
MELCDSSDLYDRVLNRIFFDVEAVVVMSLMEAIAHYDFSTANILSFALFIPPIKINTKSFTGSQLQCFSSSVVLFTLYTSPYIALCPTASLVLFTSNFSITSLPSWPHPHGDMASLTDRGIDSHSHNHRSKTKASTD